MDDDIGRKLFWIGHSSFYIKGENATVFIDPFRIGKVNLKADIILVTHPHFDHFSREDIEKVSKNSTAIVASEGTIEGKEDKNSYIARPGFKTKISGIGIEAVPAYNVESARIGFHPKSNGWVGYVIEVDGKRFYHAGDTDKISEMEELGKLDVAMLPIGGTYTMDVDDAIEAAAMIGANATVPMHYKNLLGIEGAKAVEDKFSKEVKGATLMREVNEPTFAF
ncbi:MAG: MBL fold metallo-hydrolase [Candidatus Marsarchaeota archaeon]|jgi:Predicted Zn-dependent hydrolases of the beta-lactamase fold|nr:MBL fold metallo-hydrolase [Candidatus Marsarchaeota archaeon]